MNKYLVFVAQAYRFGESDGHSYVVGGYPKKYAAIKAAEEEEDFRGHKYGVAVNQVPLGTSIHDGTHKQIRKPYAK